MAARTKRSLLVVMAVLVCTAVFPSLASAVVHDVKAGGSDVGGCGTSPGGCATINFAISEASNGDIVDVEAGLYTEDVVVNKEILLNGDGASSTTIVGPIGGNGAGIQVQASNVTIDGFTVTRQGNNTTDWNNGGLNTVGLAIQGQALVNIEVRNSVFTGNRTGIDINNSNGHNVHHNNIVDNRTGMIFRNQTDNLQVKNNRIADNWTAGIVFLDASGGSNSPIQTAANGQFHGNDISGNWYAAIVDRQTGGSLPAPGSNLKNFSGNWLGTTTPTVTTNNSAEPGYAAQIPAAYGGVVGQNGVTHNAAPGGQPDIAGAASANVDFTPMLSSGTDSDGGAPGFQGDLTDITVTDEGAQTGSAGRVQEGIDRIFGNGTTVRVQPGSYGETPTFANTFAYDGVTLTGTDENNRPTINGGLAISIDNNELNGLTVRDMKFDGHSGDARNGVITMNAMTGTGSVNNLTLDNIEVDGQDAQGANLAFQGGGRNAIYGKNMTGTVSVVDSEFKNLIGPTLFDTNWNGGTAAGKFPTRMEWIGNTVQDTDSGAAFRGQLSPLVRTPEVVVEDSTWTNIGPATNSFGAAVKAFNVVDFTFTGNTIDGVGTSGFAPGGEDPIGGGVAVKNTEQMHISGNTIMGAQQGFLADPGALFLPEGEVEANTFDGNNSAIYIPNSVNTASTPTIERNRILDPVTNNGSVGLDLENNWWGCNTGACITTAGDNAAGIDVDPQLVLSVAASPDNLNVGNDGVFSITGTKNSDDDTVAGDYFDADVATSNAGGNGTYNPSFPTDVPFGEVTDLAFTGTTPGTETVTAQLDSASVDDAIQVVADNPANTDSQSEVVPGGGEVSTSENGDPADAGDPVETSVTSPNPGTVTIEETAGDPPAPNDDPPLGYDFLGQHVEITAPDGTVNNPLELTFSIYAPGVDPADVKVQRNGTEVDDCAIPANVDAVPNPCVASITQNGDVLTIVVYTVSASVWAFSVDADPPTTATVSLPGEQNWFPRATGTSGSKVSYENGPPVPPLGSGSVKLEVGADGNEAAELRNTAYHGQRLDEITALSYDSYTDVDGIGGQAPYIILQLDLDGNLLDAAEDLIFFEPEYQSGVFFPLNPQGPLTDDVWQHWDALEGGWWSVNNFAGAGPGANVKSLGQYLVAQPNARIVNSVSGLGGVRLVTGFGAPTWNNFEGYADNFRIDFVNFTPDNVFDFEAPNGNGDASFSNSDPVTTEGTLDALNPVVTTVDAAAAGTTEIVEGNGAPAVPAGWTAFGQKVDITTPNGALGNPITLTFELHDSAVPNGIPLNQYDVFKSGGPLPVPDCTDTVNPTPDPCVASRTANAPGAGDLTIVVKTTTASPWSFGTDTTPPQVHLTTPSNDDLTNDNSPTFSGAAGDDVDDLNTVRVSIWDAPPTFPSGPADYYVDVDRTADGDGDPAVYTTSGPFIRVSDAAVVATLPDGSYSALAQQDDMSGNTGNSDSLFGEAPRFTIDATDPVVTLDPVTPNPTDDNPLTLTGTAGMVSVGTPPAPVSDDDNFVTINVYDGDDTGDPLLLTDTAPVAAGAWTKNLAISDGERTIEVLQSDDAGNQGTSGPQTIFVDTVDPTVSITARPSSPDDDPNPSWTWTDNDAAPSAPPFTKECRLNKTNAPAEPQATNTFGPCDTGSTHAYTGLSDGDYEFTIRVTDGAGNSAEETDAFTIDTADPAVAITSGPTGPTTNNDPVFDLDVSDADPSSGVDVECRLTKSDAPAEPQATGTFGPCSPDDAVTAASDGNDGQQAYTDLADGDYVLDVRVTDGAGNVGTDSRAFFVDTVNPTVSITARPNSPDNDPNVSFTWTDHDPAPSAPPFTKECRLDKLVGPADPQATGTFGPCDTGATHGYNGLSDGTYQFTIRVTDGAGNEASDIDGFVIDTVAPTATITTGPSGNTNQNDHTFEFATSDPDPTSSGLLVECRLTKGEAPAEPQATGTFGPCSPDDTGTPNNDGIDSSQDYTDLADGSYTLDVRATDNAGNVSPLDTRAFFVDTTNPTVSITANPPAIGNNPNVSFTWTDHDPAPSSGLTKSCELDKTSNGADPAEGTQACGSTLSYNGLSEGDYTFTVTVTDGAGNTASDSHNFYVDTSTPGTVLDPPLPNDPTANNDPTFNFHSTEVAPFSPGGVSYECELTKTGPAVPHLHAFQPCGTGFAPAPNPQTKSYTNLPDGTYTFRVRARDFAGNVDGPSSHTWTINTNGPTVTINFPKHNGNYSMHKDDNLIVDYFCAPGGTPLLPPPADCEAEVRDSGNNVVQAPEDGDQLYNDAEGTYTFTVRSEDTAGNVTTKTHTYHVWNFPNLINNYDPIAYYRMNDPGDPNDVMADHSGNGHNGQYKNDQDSGPEGISGDGDFARAFFGDAGYGYVNGITAPKKYTLSAFVKFDDTGDQVILQHGGGGSLYLQNGEFKFKPVDEVNDVILSGLPPVDPVVHADQWYHVVGTLGEDGSNKASLYIDGSRQDGPRSLGGKRPSGISTFYVGFGNLGLSRPWLRGALDEVAYFGTALSAEHIYEIWLADPPPKNKKHPGDVSAPSVAKPEDKPNSDNGDDPTSNDAPDSGGDDKGDGGSGDGDDSEIQENQVEDGDDTLLAPVGTWVRKDGSTVEITLAKSGNKWIGKTVVTVATAKKGKKAKKAKKAKAAKSCGLKKGTVTLAMKERKAGGYKGEILDAVMKKGDCKAKRATFTAKLSEDGNSLTLKKKRGKKKSTEVLTRSVG